ncbi:MAG: glycosyltransferase family 2 protein, partial [Proteobacteria bacterium]|nr:glycosyltransferase family 2 protein [Pseudomonadota bacterium]
MSASPPTLELSIVIIALNEEANLSRCLSSLPQGAEIVLLDSESSDQTVAIAKSFGALVFQRSFTNFAEQKNAALAFASRRWVLAIDADEELDAALRTAILEVVQHKNPEIQAWRLQRRLVFMGRRLRYGKTCDWPIRLFLRENAYYRGS